MALSLRRDAPLGMPPPLPSGVTVASHLGKVAPAAAASAQGVTGSSTPAAVGEKRPREDEGEDDDDGAAAKRPRGDAGADAAAAEARSAALAAEAEAAEEAWAARDSRVVPAIASALASQGGMTPAPGVLAAAAAALEAAGSAGVSTVDFTYPAADPAEPGRAALRPAFEGFTAEEARRVADAMVAAGVAFKARGAPLLPWGPLSAALS